VVERRAPVVVFSGGGTGGHLYPALTLADALVQLRPDVQVHFVGARRGVEARILPERGRPHTLLPVRGMPRRGGVLDRLAVVPALATSLARAGALLLRLRPALVVVTGGYAGAPAGIAARGLRVALALQEQNAYPGFTTRMLAAGARQIHVAYPEAVERLPWEARAATRVSGNPVRPPAPTERGRACRTFGLDPEGLVLLVVGGSQGSRALNEGVLAWLETRAGPGAPLPGGVQLLWSTGPDHIGAVRQALSELGHPEGVHATGYLDDMALALSCADLALSRAGAMATSEFLAWGVPALLVPLPTAAADHQSANAQALHEAGAAVHLPEADLDADTLHAAVVRLAANPKRRTAMAEAARGRGRPDAAREIATRLAELLPPFTGSGRRQPGTASGEVAS
jgi:UDP-N-acetylglucosamine--N-acetylmuramyl-(pentapeptide) pyrophosphoryl-undecaprenol N-acetylglucosamine transferase